MKIFWNRIMVVGKISQGFMLEYLVMIISVMMIMVLLVIGFIVVLKWFFCFQVCVRQLLNQLVMVVIRNSFKVVKLVSGWLRKKNISGISGVVVSCRMVRRLGKVQCMMCNLGFCCRRRKRVCILLLLFGGKVIRKCNIIILYEDDDGMIFCGVVVGYIYVDYGIGVGVEFLDV